MISLTAAQKDKAYNARPQVVTLVRIETFSDYAAKTSEAVRYYATVPIRYRWDGATVNDFRGFLARVTPIERGFEHIPGDSLGTLDAVRLDFDASLWGDQNPYEDLIGLNILGAQIEIASLLIDADDAAGWGDQGAATADHIVRFRGEISRLPDYTEDQVRFSLLASVLEPVLDWPIASDVDQVDPRDLGKRYPLPVGIGYDIPLINRQIGSNSTLNQDYASTGTATINVSDTLGFPQTGSFLVQVGLEVFDVTYLNGAQLTVNARAQNGTTAAPHGAGSTIVEIVDAVHLVVSGFEIQSLDALFMISQTGERVRVPQGLYGWNPGNAQIEPGYTCGVVGLSATQLQVILETVGRDVSQQPDATASTAGVETIQVKFGSIDVSQTDPDANNSTAFILDGNVILNKNTSGSPQEVGTFYNSSGAVPNQSRTVSRFRPVFSYRIESDGTNTTRFQYELDDVLNVTLGATLLDSYTVNGEKYETQAGAWQSPSSTTMADLINTGGAGSSPRLKVYLDQTPPNTGGLPADIEVGIIVAGCYWEIELEPLVTTVTVDTPAEISGGARYGNGLQFVAQVRGIVDRSGEAVVSGLDFTDLTGWAGISGTISLNLGGIMLELPTNNTFSLRKTGLGGLDWSAAGTSFSFEMLSGRGDLARINDADAYGISILIETGAGSSEYGFSSADVLDTEWTTLLIDFDRHPTQRVNSGTGADLTDVQNIRFQVRLIVFAAGSPQFRFRDARTVVRSRNENPIGVAEYLIENVAGLTGGADATTFASAQANQVSGHDVDGDLRNLGETLSEQLSGIGVHCRTNFVVSESSSGTLYKAHNASTGYAFGSSVRTLDAFEDLVTGGASLLDLPTEFVALYEFRNSFSASGIEGYRALAQANASTNDLSAKVPTIDITAAQSRVGVRKPDPLAFLLTEDLTTIVDTFGYYVSEALRAPRRHELKVDYRLGYDLEPGDIVTITPTYSSSAVKCRVLFVRFPFDEPLISLSLIEVV